MERIRRFFRKLGKGLKEKGYTLVEVAAVVAVTGTLAAVVVPIAVDKVKQGKEAAAKNDCIQIGVAITGFYKDTGEWPAYYGTTTVVTNLTYFYALRSGNEVGNLGVTHDPGNAASKWTQVTADRIDLLERHLVIDSPGGNANGYLTTAKLNWKGPYSESLNKRDPWGNNYLVYVKAMHTATTGSSFSKQYGWIISSGPNATLETAVTDNILQGDDIGVMLYAAEIGH